MKSFILLFTIAITLDTFGQPNTEIYLFDLEQDDQDNYSLVNPINITQNEGYDNQPAFWPDGSSILYARTVNSQTEIAQYTISDGETKIITQTLQGSEYSPTPTPDGMISSIRLDTSGLQLLYSYDFKGNYKVLVNDVVIGYHTWIDHSRIMAFVLGEPNTLQIIDVSSGSSKSVAENIGRSLHKIPKSKHLSYVDKSGDEWMIKAIHLKKNTKMDIVRTIEGAEDYCWTPQGKIIMGQDETLWIWDSRIGWKELFNISPYGLTGITRVVVSPKGNQLALVVNK